MRASKKGKRLYEEAQFKGEKMNKRDLRLEKYGISKKRYKELCGFCEQYPEWKSRLREFALIKGVSYSLSPRSNTNAIHSPVEDAVIKMDKYLNNCNLIEEVAVKADPEFWEYIIKAVCYGVSVTYLTEVEEMNLSKSAFYERKRYFFYLLDKTKQ